MASTTTPMMVKMDTQLSPLSRSKPMKPPNTTSTASRGIMALMPSAAPRLVSSVMSVSQALKQASLAVEPKKVMTQSMMITRVTPTAATDSPGNTAAITSSRMKAKLQMVMPQIR